jgi:hypothetical protein
MRRNSMCVRIRLIVPERTGECTLLAGIVSSKPLWCPSCSEAIG